MEMLSHPLAITIISGEGLRNNRQKPVKKNVFVTVKSDSQNVNSTRIDVEGGSYPVWNEKLDVKMPMHARFLTVEVHCKVSKGSQVIGTAKIPVLDFTGAYFPENYLHFLSYRLRDINGERNGIINLSIRMNGNAAGFGGASSSNDGGCAANHSRVMPPRVSAPMVGRVSNGIVTGVPVYHRYN